jgi:hypothetical protein
MERRKLKLAVIALLGVLNLCLLGVVVSQSYQAHVYQRTARTQAVSFVTGRGITLRESQVPWESALSTQSDQLAAQVLDQSTIPAQGLAENCELETAGQPETLLVDLALGLEDLGATPAVVTAITEGYGYTSQGDRGVLTPQWQVATDQGTYLLDCATGTVTQSN